MNREFVAVRLVLRGRHLVVLQERSFSRVGRTKIISEALEAYFKAKGWL